MMDMRRDFQGMQEISAANEGVLCQKFKDILQKLSEFSRELAEGNTLCVKDISDAKEKLNTLVSRHLPENFTILQQDMQKVFLPVPTAPADPRAEAEGDDSSGRKKIRNMVTSRMIIYKMWPGI